MLPLWKKTIFRQAVISKTIFVPSSRLLILAFNLGLTFLGVLVFCGLFSKYTLPFLKYSNFSEAYFYWIWSKTVSSLSWVLYSRVLWFGSCMHARSTVKQISNSSLFIYAILTISNVYLFHQTQEAFYVCLKATSGKV